MSSHSSIEILRGEKGRRTSPAKPDWAMTQRERRRAALRAAGIETRSRWPLAIAAVAVAGGIATAGFLWVSSAETDMAPPPAISAPEPMLIDPLDVMRIVPQTLKETIRVAGPLAPRRLVQLSAGVAGPIKAVNVRLGDRVREGRVLVEIDVDAMRRQLAQQKAMLAANQAQFSLAESQLQRSEQLAQRGIAAMATLESSRGNLEVQRANLQAQQASVDAAEITLRNAAVVAPFDGVVASRDVEPGQTVASGANLVQIADLSAMTMAAVVPVSSSANVRSGDEVTFSVDGMDGSSFVGRVESVGPTALAGTRDTPVSITIDNSQGLLRGGMFASGQIVLSRAANAIGVPAEAIFHDQAGPFVLKIVGDRVERQAVRPGPAWNGGSTVQITEGLVAGDRIISRPLKTLTAGMAVQTAAK